MNVRAKGHALERSDAKYIRENTAFVNVKTARYASKLHDDAKIDLVYIPYAWQCKAGYNRGINYEKLIAEMETAQKQKLGELLPIIIHHKKTRKNNKKQEDENMIIMKKEVFETFLPYANDILIKYINPNLIKIQFDEFRTLFTGKHPPRSSTERHS
jgi:16S rRNA G966 N2-methylase RsmD